jgi:hypothetical protein
MSARSFTPAAGSTFTYATPQTNNATGAPAALTISGLDASKQTLLQRAAGLESTSTSISTQTTGWTLGLDVGTSGGSAATNISTRSEFLADSGASFTSQPGGTSGDGCSIMIAITETPPAVTTKPSGYAFITD